MKRGRKPDATMLKLVKGARDADPSAASAVLEPLPGPPAHWRPKAKMLWHEIAASIPHGVASRHDKYLVEVTATLIAKMRSEPSNITPALAAQIRTALGELGMTPGARAQLASLIDVPYEKDEFFDND